MEPSVITDGEMERDSSMPSILFCSPSVITDGELAPYGYSWSIQDGLQWSRR